MNEKRKKIIKTHDALLRLEALCARSEQCVADLRQKLYRWGLASNDIDEVITKLIESRFVDDARFAMAYCRDKYRFNKWGRRKIVYGLHMKQISTHNIQAAIQAIDEEEYIKILVELIKSKAKMIVDADTYEGRTRLYRFALSRGYESELVAKIIKDKSQWN